jgi:hypothetical protein
MFRPFIDVDLAFANGLNITAEYQTKDDIESKALSSLIARYPLTKQRTLLGEIGLTNAINGIAGGKSHQLVAGLNYTFGK